MSKARQILYITVGIISLALGVIGIFLPVLPTTPFILLTAWCFYHGSPRFHDWFVDHPRFGPIVEEYGNGEGMTQESKIKAIVMTWAMIILTIILFLDTLHNRLIVVVLGVIGSSVILSLKTREN